MASRLFAALLGAMLLYAAPSFSQNQDGQGDNNNNQGKTSAPEFDGQTAAMGLAVAGAAVLALKSRFGRRRQ